MNLAERIAQITAETSTRIAESIEGAVADSMTDEAYIAYELFEKHEDFIADQPRINAVTLFEAGRHFGASEERRSSLGLDS